MSNTNTGRYKVAIVADTPDWAYDNIASQIKEYLQHKFDIQIFYIRDFADWQALYRFFFMNGSFDLIHFLWREVIVNPAIIHPLSLALSPEDRKRYIEGFVTTPITASIYDHSCLGEPEITERKFYLNYVASAYTVSSRKLYDIYSQISELVPPAAVIEDGVNLSLFYPINKERFAQKTQNLVIGWVGNSQWGMEDGVDKKGFQTIVQPAVAALQEEGFAIQGFYADRKDGQIALADMKDYYAKIDVLICASLIEGTPNPVLEAMACGVPVVSTDVGIVKQVFGAKQKDFIFERNINDLKDKLKKILQEPSIRQELSEENLVQILEWTREAESKKWDSFLSAYCKCKGNIQYHKDCLMKRKMFLADDMGEYAFMAGKIEEYQDAYENMTRMIDERDAYIKALEAEVSGTLFKFGLGPLGQYRIVREKKV